MPYDKYFSVTQGKKVSVVIRWSSQLAYDRNPDRVYSDWLGADLDLLAYGPNDPNAIRGSYSWDNNYEILGFTAPTTGTYKISIIRGKSECSDDYGEPNCEDEYVGLAICKC